MQTTPIYKIYVDTINFECKIYKYPHENTSTTALLHKTLSCYRINGATTDLDNMHGKCVIFQEPPDSDKFNLSQLKLNMSDYIKYFDTQSLEDNKSRVHYITHTDNVGGTENIYKVTATKTASDSKVTIRINACKNSNKTWIGIPIPSPQ